MKIYITKKTDIGKSGPGQYVLEDGKHKDGKPKRKVITVMDKSSKVDQAQAHLTDVHTLLEPAIKAGLLRHVIQYEGEYDDIPVKTYEEGLNAVSKANQMFEALPAAIRNEFGNDTKTFLAFTQNPANVGRMQELGILKGNDGLTGKGTPSGAPTPTDTNGDGIPDPAPPPTPPV